MHRMIFIIMLILAICGCRKPVRIGAKPFTEQMILAEIIAQLAQNKGIPVKTFTPYGNTLECLDGLKNSDIDIYVEYSGTGLMLMGEPAIKDADKAFERAKTLFAAGNTTKNLKWQDRLGFENNYVLVMQRDKATKLGIKNISDLEKKFSDGIRFGCDDDFLKETLDGFPALLMHYGLKKSTPPLAVDDKMKMYTALSHNEIDIAVGYSTDGHIDVFNFVILDDDENFFPTYEPAPLVNAKMFEQYPEFKVELAKLKGLISTKKMREMNRQVELDGKNYKTVARQFLEQNNLIAKKKSIRTQNELVVAVEYSDDPVRGETGKAITATRKTFGGREIKVLPCNNPGKMVLDKKARFAMISAESFFATDQDSYVAKQNYLEAFAVIGYRMCHLITSGKNEISSLSQMKRLGVGPENGVSHRTAQILLKGLKLENKITLQVKKIPEKAGIKEIKTLFQQQLIDLNNNKLDGILLMVPVSHPFPTTFMQNNSLKLLSLEEWHKQDYRYRFPFFRLSRIPANKYSNQAQSIKTISSQIVLAQPGQKDNLMGNAGPTTAPPANTQPLSNHRILKLNNNLGMEQQIDPLLPASKALKTNKSKGEEKNISQSYGASALNIIVILGLIYLFRLFLREEPEKK